MRKRKLKKWVKILLICIICLVISIIISKFICQNKDTNNNKTLMGNKIVNGLYEYNLGNNKNIQNIIINNNDNDIYYLTNHDNNYKLYEMNAYSKKEKEINSINSEVCILNNYYLSCSSGEDRTIYNTNFKELYKGDDFFDIIPYQDLFLIIKDKNIYLNNKKIRTIKDDIERFDIIDYYVTKDNTYIEFISLDDLYIYNVKDDSYNKLELNNMHSYFNGFYYANDDKIVVMNLDSNTTKEYNNFIKDNDLEYSTIKDDKIIYMDNNYLKIYDLNINKLKYLDYRFDSSVDRLVVNNEYLYLIFQGDNPKVYVVNINEIDSPYYTLDEYKEIQLDKISKRVNELENKYNNYVDIVYDSKDIDDYKKWSEKIVNENRYEMIFEALDEIDNVLNKLGKDFLTIFKEKDYKGLRIVISKDIEASSGSKVKDLAGFFFLNDTYYNVIVSKNGMPYEKTFCHEMMHAIDENALINKYDIAGNWYDYNPKKFEYNVNHYLNDDVDYTLYSYVEDEIKNAYFIDAYSKTNQLEDRARVFENICYKDKDIMIKDHPNLLKKAKYLKSGLIKYYGVLDGSSIFDSIN